MTHDATDTGDDADADDTTGDCGLDDTADARDDTPTDDAVDARGDTLTDDAAATPTTDGGTNEPPDDADPDDATASEEDLTVGLQAGRNRAEAAAIRESFEPRERERVEETVADLLDLLGRAHAMAVLVEFAFADEPLRFSELESALGVSPNTLTERLKEFTEAGLLDRTAYDEIPPRVEYEPTDRAEALFPAFAHLHHWAIEYEL